LKRAGRYKDFENIESLIKELEAENGKRKPEVEEATPPA
jgi:hypothetical protein